MTWQEKMNMVINEVLGEGYVIKIIDTFKFEVYYADELLFKTETLSFLDSHWRKCVKEAILLIIEKRIIDALSKVNSVTA